MIVTVSPNAALDRVRVVRGFRPGEQTRALSEFLQPGGSGVHAAEVIQALGGESLALGLLGGRAGELWKAEADTRGLAYDMVPIPAETRESFCLVDVDQGSVVESVVEGRPVHAEFGEALLARLEARLGEAELLIVSGSLPPALGDDLYSRMISLAQRAGVQTLADIHSEPLRLAVSANPWMIKPNLAEFEELTGGRAETLAERAAASREFCDDTGVALALSMGAGGLLLSTTEGQWLLRPPAAEMHLPGGAGRNTIGCGDALVGALACEYGSSGDLITAARLGLAAAHLNLSTFGVPEIDAERVRELAVGVEVVRLSGNGT
jgi:1-phosphofructokinase family hexose kinase